MTSYKHGQIIDQIQHLSTAGAREIGECALLWVASAEAAPASGNNALPQAVAALGESLGTDRSTGKDTDLRAVLARAVMAGLDADEDTRTSVTLVRVSGDVTEVLTLGSTTAWVARDRIIDPEVAPVTPVAGVSGRESAQENVRRAHLWTGRGDQPVLVTTPGAERIIDWGLCADHVLTERAAYGLGLGDIVRLRQAEQDRGTAPADAAMAWCLPL